MEPLHWVAGRQLWRCGIHTSLPLHVMHLHIILQALEYRFNIVDVLLLGLREDQNVIQIDKKKSLYPMYCIVQFNENNGFCSYADDNAVKATIVNVGSQCPILLADEDKPGQRRRGRGRDETLHGLSFRFRQRGQGPPPKW